MKPKPCEYCGELMYPGPNHYPSVWAKKKYHTPGSDGRNCKARGYQRQVSSKGKPERYTKEVHDFPLKLIPLLRRFWSKPMKGEAVY